jgi:hypothetical protein
MTEAKPLKRLQIAEHLSLPVSAVTEKLAFLGRTGSGKTYGAMKLAELMLEAGAQIGAIDPVGVWRALRVPAKKGGPSFDVVVFGGLDGGDLPAPPTAGELIADLVCDRGISFVLDVSQLIPSEQQCLVRAFADRFFHRKKSAPSAVHLFIEECQEFIPENPSGDEAKTLGVMQRMWKLGRNFGIGGSLISQRPQEIAKKALNMSGTLFAFQMTGPQERKAIRAWVADQGVSVEIESILQKLDIGQPHVESPMFLNVSTNVRILPRVTADLSSTPDVGTGTASRRPLTPIDVEQLKTAMSDTIEKAKADDPRELRKRIAELERQAKAVAQANPKPEPIRQPASLTARELEVLSTMSDRIHALHTFLTSEAEAIVEHAKTKIASAINTAAMDMAGLMLRGENEITDRLTQRGYLKALEKVGQLTAQKSPYEISRTGQVPVKQYVENRSIRQVKAAGPGESMPPGERAVLTAAAMYSDGVTRDQLGVLTGYKRSSRDAYVARLAQKGWLDPTSNGHVRASQAGIDALGASFEPLPTGSALLEWWRGRLPEGERVILDVLVQANGQPMSRESLDEHTPYKRSSRDAYLARLSARKLVESVGRGEVQASKALFG